MKMRPSLPSAVAYLALAGLVAETRLELFALRKSDAQRRGLEQSDADVLSAAKLLEKELEKLRAEGGAADERLAGEIRGVETRQPCTCTSRPPSATVHCANHRSVSAPCRAVSTTN